MVTATDIHSTERNLASVPPTSFRLRVAYDYDNWSHLKRIRREETNGETYWEAQASDAFGHIHFRGGGAEKKFCNIFYSRAG